MRAFVHAALALAMMAAVNLHLPLLQVVAWGRMLATYSQGRTLAEAAEMTFGGEHPCPMCKAIKKQQEKKTDLKSAVQAPPTIFILCAPATWIQHLRELGELRTLVVGLRGVARQPPRMPPRNDA